MRKKEFLIALVGMFAVMLFVAGIVIYSITSNTPTPSVDNVKTEMPSSVDE